MSLPISLPDLADYCRLMSGAAEPTPAERHLWADLAQEIDTYLCTPTGDDALFDPTPTETRTAP